MAHLNRQEANFNWSLPHSAAVYVTTKREGGRGRERGRVRGETMMAEGLKRAERENKRQAGGWRRKK